MAIGGREAVQLVCPVCDFVNSTRQCSRCDTDLAPLARVVELPLQYFDEGRALLNQGRLQGAMEKLTAASVLNPEVAEVHEALGEALEKQGRLEEAGQEFRATLSLAPDSPSAAQSIERIDAALRQNRERANPATVGLWIASVTAVVLAAVVLTMYFRTPPAEPAEARLVRVRQWLVSQESLKNSHLDASLQGGLIAVAGSVPTPLHLELLREGVQRAAGASVDLHGVDVKPPAEPARPRTVYKIRAGDNYSKISQRLYGTAQFWKTIAEANASQHPRAKGLVPGDEVALPVLSLAPRQVSR